MLRFLLFLSAVLGLLLSTACSSLSKLKQQEQRAIGFLEKAEFRFDYLMLYAHLQTCYAWPPLSKTKELDEKCQAFLKSEDSELQETGLALQLFSRLYKPNYNILDTNELAKAKPLDKITLQALYCDVNKIDSNQYFSQLQQMANGEEYYCTHSLLALYWLQRYGCFTSKDLMAVKSYLIAKNKALIASRKGTWDDIAIESMALMMALGEKIPQKWIKEISALQLSDGGWSDKSSVSTSNSHTTILALWCIGEQIARSDRSKKSQNCK